MGDIRSFRDILAWQAGMELAAVVYAWIPQFPSSERYNLTSQLQRAVVSVPSNIAEGWGAGTTRLFLRRLRDARGSLAEVETQLELAARLFDLNVPARVLEVRESCGRLLQALMTSLERKLAKEHDDHDVE